VACRGGSLVAACSAWLPTSGLIQWLKLLHWDAGDCLRTFGRITLFGKALPVDLGSIGKSMVLLICLLVVIT
jgi:hypothetical protein